MGKLHGVGGLDRMTTSMMEQDPFLGTVLLSTAYVGWASRPLQTEEHALTTCGQSIRSVRTEAANGWTSFRVYRWREARFRNLGGRRKSLKHTPGLDARCPMLGKVFQDDTTLLQTTFRIRFVVD